MDGVDLSKILAIEKSEEVVDPDKDARLLAEFAARYVFDMKGVTLRLSDVGAAAVRTLQRLERA